MVQSATCAQLHKAVLSKYLLDDRQQPDDQHLQEGVFTEGLPGMALAWGIHSPMP